MLKNISEFIVTFLTDYGLFSWFGMVLVLGVLFYFMSLKRKKNKDQPKAVTKKEVNTFLCLLGAAICISLFISEINPRYIGYGFSTDGYKNLAHTNTVFCSMNENKANSKRGSHIINYRLQGIDLVTGKIKYTTMLDNDFKVLGFCSPLLLAYAKNNKEIKGIDITTGKSMAVLNEKTAKQHFPELASGIYKCDFNSKTKLIDVVSKNGLHVSVDPIQLKIIPDPSGSIVKNEYEITSHGIYERTDTANDNTSKLIGFNEAPVINKLTDKNGQVLNENTTFILGKFIMYDKPSNKAIILSYETEEKKNVLISCVTTDGKLLWQAKKDQLAIGDFFNSHPAFETCFIENENIIIDFEGFVFSLNSSNGKLNWSTRL